VSFTLTWLTLYVAFVLCTYLRVWWIHWNTWSPSWMMYFTWIPTWLSIGPLEDVERLLAHLMEGIPLLLSFHIFWKTLSLMMTWFPCWDTLAPIGYDLTPWWWDLAPLHDDLAPYDEMAHLLGHGMTLDDETLQSLEPMFHFWSPYTWFVSEESTYWGHMFHKWEMENTFMRDVLSNEHIYFIFEASFGILMTYPLFYHGYFMSCFLIYRVCKR